MKINKIDVLTSNKKHATDIALLVSKPEFLIELKRLREKWKPATQYMGKNYTLDERALLYYTELSDKEKEERLPEFNADINNVLKTFNREKNFRRVVIYALFTGVIPDFAYKSCYFDIVTINEKEDANKPEKYQYVIVMSPRAEKQEVLQAYKEFEAFINGYEGNEFELGEIGKIKFEKMSKELKFSSENPDDVAEIERYYKGSVYPAADINKFKTQKELERTREWHWIQYKDVINGTSDKPLKPAEVCKEWQDRCLINKGKKLKEKDYCECEYCIDAELVMKRLAHFNNLLSHS